LISRNNPLDKIKMEKMSSSKISGPPEIRSPKLLTKMSTPNNSMKFIPELLKELTDGMLFLLALENNTNGKNPPLISTIHLSSKILL